jgi:hypothetical protein
VNEIIAEIEGRAVKLLDYINRRIIDPEDGE